MRQAHRLKSLRPPLVDHFLGCGCDFIRSVRHAPWVSYDMVDGMLSCSHCDTTLVLPTPSVLTGTGEAEVYMDHEAIQDELNRFKNKHQDCPHKAEDCNHPDLMGAL